MKRAGSGRRAELLPLSSAGLLDERVRVGFDRRGGECAELASGHP
jgi:hypothetical protein